MWAPHDSFVLLEYHAQDCPLDLDSSDGAFAEHPARRAIILATLDKIAAATPQVLVRWLGHQWRRHQGTRCRGVHWDTPLHLVQVVAACVGGPVVASVCRTLVRNYRHFCGGMPDLMLLRLSLIHI